MFAIFTMVHSIDMLKDLEIYQEDYRWPADAHVSLAYETHGIAYTWCEIILMFTRTAICMVAVENCLHGWK